MVIHNFHIINIAVRPLETNAPLVINADAVLPFAVTFKRFQMIAGGLLQVIERPRPVQSKQTTFVERGIAQCPPEGGTPIAPSEKVLCQVPIAIALDAALPSLENARIFVSSLRSTLPCQRSSPSPRNDYPNRAVS